MSFNEEDFKEYLYYNFPDDYRSYTKAEIEGSAKTSIINRHERKYGIWQSLSSESWIRAFYGNRLPTELFSGQLNLQDFREKVLLLVTHPEIYLNSEILALRMQYSTTMPNMVYDVVPYKEIRRYANILEKAGYDENNLGKALSRKEKSFTYMGKLQSIGVSKKQAQSIMSEAESINLAEQFSDLNHQLRNAQSKEELEHASKQMDAFLKVHAKDLYNQREDLHQIHQKLSKNKKKNKLGKKIKQLKQPTEAPKITQNIEEEKQQISEPKAPEEKTTTSLKPTFLEELDHHDKKDEYGIKTADENFSIYDYLNNRMDSYVDKQLKSLDKRVSEQKANQQFSAKGMSSIDVSGRLQDNIDIPQDLHNWSNDYLSTRSEEDERWYDDMSKGMSILETASLRCHDAESYAKAIRESLHAQNQQLLNELNSVKQANTAYKNELKSIKIQTRFR